MISERYLTLHGKTLQQVYDETTMYYVTERLTQARNNVMLMSREQRKEYLLQVLDQYPDNKPFREFIIGLI